MTPDHAATWNAAIQASTQAYPNGIGAIKALRKQVTVTVKHQGRSTIQEVEVVEDSGSQV